MNINAPKAGRGGSLLETMLVLALISILVLAVVNRSITLRVEAERTALEGVVQSVRSAALEHSLQRRVASGRDSAELAADSNPMLWLERPPLNYLGELAGPDPAMIPGGQWYFDTTSRLLVYRVEYATYFQSPLPGAAQVRFKVGSAMADTKRDSVERADRDAARGVTIEVVEPYSWRRHPVSLNALRIWGVLGASP